MIHDDTEKKVDIHKIWFSQIDTASASAGTLASKVVEGLSASHSNENFQEYNH